MLFSDVSSVLFPSDLFLVSNDAHTVRHALRDLKKVFSGPKFKRSDFLDLLCLLFSLVKLARKKGPNEIEGHIERTLESAAFQAYPRILADHLARPDESSVGKRGVRRVCARWYR